MPLHIVLRGIEKVFDGYDAKPNKRRAIKSLTYCREEIEAQYEEWSERQVGKSTEESSVENAAHQSLFDDDAICEHLARVAAELNGAAEKADADLREVLERVLQRLRELEKTRADAESLESALSDLEKIIDEALLETTDKSELAELNTQAAKNLAPYLGKMEKEVYARTFDLMILKSLRERHTVPRLSLFYL